MATFHINWSLTGTKTIEAASREEAERIFEQLTNTDLAETGELDSYFEDSIDFDAWFSNLDKARTTDDAARIDPEG